MKKDKLAKTILTAGVIAGVAYGAYTVLSNSNIKVTDISSELYTNGNFSQRDLSQIDEVVVHHSATTSGSAKSYSRYHVQKRGWAGIGYHIHCPKEGGIEFCQSLKNISYHTAGKNTNSIGICMTGNYDIQTPIDVQIRSVNKAIFMLEKLLNKKLKISFHNEYANKSCPGKKITKEMFGSSFIIDKVPSNLI